MRRRRSTMTDAPDYATQSPMSDPGRQRGLIAALPGDVAELARIVQGWCVHDFVAESFYGLKVPEQRRGDIHIRPVEAMLDCLLAMDERPLTEPRPVEKRLAIRCRHYALLHIAALREKGVPARMRGGFSAYFNPPYFEDHWITEYWNDDRSRWVLVDPQLDDIWMQKLGGSLDPLDLKRDQFIVSAEAWKMCRDGRADPKMFGIGVGDLRGLWFVASSLIRDLAALNKAELLPWDVWGAQPAPDAKFSEQDLAFFDDVAELTANPRRPAREFAAVYAADPRVTAGAQVFNAITMRNESVAAQIAA
jgi:hypothetical protein